MTGYHLTATTFLPLVGAVLILLVGSERRARWIALAATVATLAVSVPLYRYFDKASSALQFVESRDWIPSWNITYSMGVDGISLPFIFLSSVLSVLCVGASWSAIQSRAREFYAALLVAETAMIGLFAASNLFLFYIFWEVMIVPLFLLIGGWGGPGRVYAAVKFLLFTLAGSVLMLVGMVALYHTFGTLDFRALAQVGPSLQPGHQAWLFGAFLAAFAVKVPMWPVHTWLPDAHVQAPTAGSVILAAVLLKFGGYGLLRFSLPMFPEASVMFTPLIYTLSIMAVIYTSLVALAQEDMKKLIAYSSVAHMAIVTAGLFAFNSQGIEGAMVMMLSHGLVSGALFLCVGVIYDRLHTREIDRYGGLATNMPRYALFFMLFTMASIGLPGTSGFVAEFISLAGVYQASSTTTFVLTTGIILGAGYMLYLYRRVVFGEQKNADAAAMPDLNAREWLMLAPVAAAVLWMGVYPESFLAPMRTDIAAIEARIARAAPQGDAELAAGKPSAHEANYIAGEHGTGEHGSGEGEHGGSEGTEGEH